jgi:hypothetical protein
MAYARTADERYDFVATTPRRKSWRRFLLRLFDSMVEGRRRAAEHEIAAFLQGSGKFLSDDAERAIERIVSSSTRF